MFFEKMKIEQYKKITGSNSKTKLNLIKRRNQNFFFGQVFRSKFFARWKPETRIKNYNLKW